MCRKQSRRCPSHTNPILQKLAVAVRLVGSWERRINAAKSDAELDHAIERFSAAIASVEERSSWDPAWNAVPPPSRVAEFTEDSLAGLAAEDLERQYGDLNFDPLSQRAIEAEWARRESAEHARRTAESAEIREIVETQLAPDCLPSLDANQLTDMWHIAAGHPDLQNRIEAELARRAAEPETDAWGHPVTAEPETDAWGHPVTAEPETDAWGHPVTAEPAADSDIGITASEQEELQWAAENLSVDKYLELERQLITDPRLRSSKEAMRQVSGNTVAEKEQARRNRYNEFQFERYINAEAYCRGHMLNPRGEALKVDPLSLLSGGPNRMRAYASDEYKAYIGSTGGHISYALFETLNAPAGHTSHAAITNERFHDVAYA